MKQYGLEIGDPVGLERFLKRTGISQAELSKILGLSRGMVTLLKQGKTEPTFQVCRKLLLAGMTVEELFGSEVWNVAKRQALSGDGKTVLSAEECRRFTEAALASIGVDAGLM